MKIYQLKQRNNFFFFFFFFNLIEHFEGLKKNLENWCAKCFELEDEDVE